MDVHGHRVGKLKLELPGASGTVTVTCKAGGGVFGNVDAERISVVEGSFEVRRAMSD